MLKEAYRAYKREELPKNYFRAVIKCLRITGLEVEKEKESFPYKIYSIIALSFWVYTYTCVEGYEFYANIKDVNEMLNVLNYLLTHIVGVIKITDIYWNRDKYKTLIKKMHEGLFIPNKKRGGGDYESKEIRQTIKKIELQLFVFYLSVMFAVSGSTVEVIGKRILKPKKDWDMPFLNISFLDTSDSPTYDVAAFYQIFCILMQGLQIAATDVLRTSLMAHVSVQFKLLQNSLKRLKPRALILQKKLQNQYPFDYCINKTVADTVKHHLAIFDYAKELEDLGSSVIFVVMIGTVLQLCLIMYETSMIDLMSFYIVGFMSYWVGVAFQTAQYCYWGNEVTSQSEDVAKSAMESDWTDFPLASQKALILIMARSQKTLYMTAGKFLPLSIEVFASIIKGSFSYYMVLKSVNGNG